MDEVAACATSDTRGAPVAPLAMFEAPTPDAPVKAITVSDWFGARPSTRGTDCVLVTVTPLSAVAAVAVQISATPRCVAARCTRLHDSPAPETVMNWLLVPLVGPSDATSAISTSPGALGLKAGVVCAPAPSAETVTCATGPGAGAPLDTTSDTALPARALEPPLGVWLITDPAGTDTLVALLMLTVKPAPLSVACAFTCVNPTTVGTFTEAGGVPLMISTDARFHWSAVGAVSFRVAVLPVAPAAALR